MNKFSRACIISAAVLSALGATSAWAQKSGGNGGGMDLEKIVNRLMERDTNGDGKLSRDELPAQLAERLFEIGDTNKDGFLDKAEIKKAFENRPARGPQGARPGQKVQPGQPERLKGPRRGLERKNIPAFQQGKPGLKAGRPAAVSEKKMDFEDYMKVAGKALHKLRRSPLDASSQAKDLKAIQAVQYGLLNAKARIATVEMAPQAKAHYGSDEQAYLHDFHVALTKTLMESFAMEMALLDNDSAKAKESLKYLRADQKKGHKAFQEDEDDENEAHEANEHEEHEHNERDHDDDD